MNNYNDFIKDFGNEKIIKIEGWQHLVRTLFLYHSISMDFLESDQVIEIRSIFNNSGTFNDLDNYLNENF